MIDASGRFLAARDGRRAHFLVRPATAPAPFGDRSNSGGGGGGGGGGDAAQPTGKASSSRWQHCALDLAVDLTAAAWSAIPARGRSTSIPSPRTG